MAGGRFPCKPLSNMGLFCWRNSVAELLQRNAAHILMTPFAPASQQITAMNIGVTAAADKSFPLLGASLARPRLADTLILSAFSVVYEMAVILLRVRSRLMAGFSQ